MIAECEGNSNQSSQNNEFVLKDRLLYLVKRDGGLLLVIPWNLVETILYLYHNESLSVHLSRDRLYQMLRNKYYWYGMYTDVSRWVNACVDCRQVKSTRPLNHGLLQPISTTHPFEICVDLYTSWVEAAPLKVITAAEICQRFFRLIIARHGCPETLITDQGRQLVSN